MFGNRRIEELEEKLADLSEQIEGRDEECFFGLKFRDARRGLDSRISALEKFLGISYEKRPETPSEWVAVKPKKRKTK